MSRLDELIQEYCPNGVEFRKLERCCNILDKKRKPVTKAAREAGEYPYYGANGIQDYVSDYIFDGIFVLVGEDGSVITKAGTPVVTWAEGKIWVNNHAHIIEEKEGVLLRYLFHYIQTIDVTPLIHGNIPKLTGGDFKALQIAVPPLPVQREIVRILDNFTELTAELTAELAARKKQYEYYRDTILNSNYETVMLSKVADYAKGRINADELSEETYVGVDNLLQNRAGKKNSEHIPSEGKVIEFLCGDVLIGNIRPYLKKIWFANCNGGTNGDVLTIRCKDRKTLLPRYLYHVLASDDFFNYDTSNSKGAKMPRGDKDAVMRYQFVIPPLEEQQRIVDILDRFDKFCNDISEGLPAEIEARQKQYEYYRDKLLIFKELEV